MPAGRILLGGRCSFDVIKKILREASTAGVETYPHRVPSHLLPLITPDDLVKDFGDLKLFRARPDHMVLLKKSVEDFMRNEPCCVALGCQPHEEMVWPLLYNVTRYPYSFFALNSSQEVVNISFQEVVYREPAKDPRPRLPTVLSEPRDPFLLIGRMLSWVEEHLLEYTEAKKLLSNELVFTPSSLRRQKISGRIYPTIMKTTVEEATRYGIRWNIGVTTGLANTKNIAKLGSYQFLGRVPKELYRDFDGKPWQPFGEEEGHLILMDMELTRKQNIFE